MVTCAYSSYITNNSNILFAGITSALGFLEPLLNSVCDKFGFTCKKSASILCGVGFVISMFFTCGISSYLVEIVDGFLNQFGILFLIALQCIIFGWILGIDDLIEVVNKDSVMHVGKLWVTIIKYILPCVIFIVWTFGISTEIRKAFGHKEEEYKTFAENYRKELNDNKDAMRFVEHCKTAQ